MGPFTHEELSRMQRSLRQRYVKPAWSDVLDVGFGVAHKGGAVDPDREFTVCFFVKKKVDRRGRPALPRDVTVRLKRGKAFQAITLPTDVVEVGGIVPTGARVDFREAGAPKFVTTGAIITWSQNDSDVDFWGIVTVGHDLPQQSDPGPSRVVTIRARPGGVDCSGTLIWKAARHSLFDASIIQVRRNDLIAARALLADQVGDSLAPRTLNQLAVDADTTVNPGAHRGSRCACRSRSGSRSRNISPTRWRASSRNSAA